MDEKAAQPRDLEVFHEMSDRASLWFFALDRVLEEKPAEVFVRSVEQFIAEWKAHGSAVSGGARLFYGRFLLVAAEEGTTSGCSIDALFRAVGHAAFNVGAHILRPDQVFYWRSGEIAIESRGEFRKRVRDAEVSESTIVFDLSLSDVGQLRNKGWQKPIRESWHGAFFKV